MRKAVVIIGRLLWLSMGIAMLGRLARSVATVVGLQGVIRYQRAGLAGQGTLYVGAQILPDDHLFPEGGASLVIACPDGSTRSFVAGELFPNDVVQCPGDMQLVGEAGQLHPYVQRGGRQDPSIPYLIAPRATVVRKVRPALVWNAVPEATAYQITVRGGSSAWTSGDLDPAQVVRDGAGHLAPPVDLEPKTPYTVEICVRYADTRRHCTTDPDWASPVNLAFYYVPAPEL